MEGLKKRARQALLGEMTAVVAGEREAPEKKVERRNWKTTAAAGERGRLAK